MTPRRRARRWLARGVALAAVLAAARVAVGAIADAETVFRYAQRHSSESLEESQDRLFGREYMESVRAVRRRFGESGTVYFVGSRAPDEAIYFALFHLAPRPMIQFAAFGESLERAAAGPFRGVRFVVVVPPYRSPAGQPLIEVGRGERLPALELVDLGPRAREAGDARKDRP